MMLGLISGAVRRPVLHSKWRGVVGSNIPSWNFSTVADSDDIDTGSMTDKPSTTTTTNVMKEENELERRLRPSEVVKELDRHIVGQNDAKRAVAIAMRNRWRRRQLPSDLVKEVTPRNVLMIGPTGCGKTEVARRMAAMSDAPFLKVEATKFTEVGYHGRDVDQIIRDLMDVSMQLTKKRQTDKMRGQAEEITEERILDILAGPTSTSKSSTNSSRESFHEMLRDGILDSHEVEVEVPIESDKSGMFSVGGSDNNPNVVAVTDFLSRVASGRNNRGGAQTERKKVNITFPVIPGISQIIYQKDDGERGKAGNPGY